MRITRLAPVILALVVIAAACSSDGSDDAAAPPVQDLETQGVDGESVDAEITDAETQAATEPAQEGGFVAQDGDLVEVHYVGTLDDGSQFQSSRERGQPLSFTVGSGEVLSGFDAAVRGAAVGEVNTIRIEAADAYGEWSEENIVRVPFNPEQGDVAVGDQVYLNTGQQAVVLEVTDEYVELDANHWLAGEALTFEIEVVAITRG